MEKNCGLRKEVEELAARSEEMIAIKEKLQRHEEKNTENLLAYQEENKAEIQQLSNKMEASVASVSS